MASFFRLRNLASFETSPCLPWEHPGIEYPPTVTNKSKHSQWNNDPDADGYLYSAIEGVSANTRVSEENPPCLIHALVVDFDAPWDEDSIRKWNQPGRPAVCPNYAHKTFSGNVRAIYLFESPAPVHGLNLPTLFLERAIHELRCNKLHGGLDTASTRWYLYQDRGPGPCLCFHTEPVVTTDQVHCFLYKAGQRNKDWSTREDPDIPLDRVKAEVDRRFPGRWAGPFDDGSRGIRFWDPTADNPTAAVVRPAGMQCFTGDRGFMPWREIFGPEFVQDFEAETFGSLGQRCAYDGKNFWFRDDSGDWQMETDSAIRRILRGTYQFSALKPRDFPQVDQALHHVQTNFRVEKAGPFVHFPSGLIRVENERVLNISRCKCLAPADHVPTSWGDGFPWVAGFLDTFFADPGREQLDHFLAWLRWFYENGLNGTPQPGHALVIAGPAESGKTFLTTGLVDMAVGGSTDATEYLIGGTEFSTDVCASPVMAIDDAVIGTDAKTRNRYSAMVKKVTANQTLRYRRMRQDPVQVLWLGRTTITCNLDPHSMDLLPSMEMSNRDKISMFVCQRPATRFPPTREQRTEVLAREMPSFLAWLLAWDGYDRLVTGHRFGVREYHHPSLLDEARIRSPSNSFVELMETFAALKATDALRPAPEATPRVDAPFSPGVAFATHPDWGLVWRGKASQLAEQMRHSDGCQLSREYGYAQVSRLLGELKSQGYLVDFRRMGASAIWFFPLTIPLTPDTKDSADCT